MLDDVYRSNLYKFLLEQVEMTMAECHQRSVIHKLLPLAQLPQSFINLDNLPTKQI